jgi:hypothetical protein
VPLIYMQFSARPLRCSKRPSLGAVGALPHYRGSRAIARNYARDTSYGPEIARNTKKSGRVRWSRLASAHALLS